MDELFTVHTASKYCRVTPRTIINWIEAGHIACYKTVGGHRRINRPDLEAFMKKQGIPIPDQADMDSERKRILVVDDDPIIVETLVMGLTEDEHDYAVESAKDGFEAGLKVQSFKPHVVILDIMMPGIKGYDVCRMIKENPETKGTKVIVLSAYLDKDKFDKMVENGADICFVKPLPLPLLRKEVAEILGI
ncbi:MAG: response regulator [Desulfobacteraceae bacterium]|jgi:excisionase family DNA binding protein